MFCKFAVYVILPKVTIILLFNYKYHCVLQISYQIVIKTEIMLAVNRCIRDPLIILDFGHRYNFRKLIETQTPH